MGYNIIIAGAGQLGSRYLQGLAGYPEPLNIYIIDVNQSSLDRARSRWLEVAGNDLHSLHFSKDFGSAPAKTNLAIISTSADVRESVVSSLIKNSAVDNWLLEKVLAQSSESVNKIESLIGDHSNAWVNTYFRTMEWLKDIRQRSAQGPIEMEVIGGNLGIGCNAVHFLDFAAWWNGEEITTIDNSGLAGKWHPAKRPGFWEINGCLSVGFSGGSIARLISNESSDPFVIKIKTEAEEWLIDWPNSVAIKNDGFRLPGKILLQSEKTKDLVTDMLIRKQCALPSLQASAKLHQPILNSLLDHWNKTHSESADQVPIT